MSSKILLGATLVIGLLISTHSMAIDYIIDKKGQHASVNFKASHLGYSYITGRFNDFTGKFKYNPDNPDDSIVSVKIIAKSLDSNHAERDKHLRESDFFDVKKYPLIEFKSTSYSDSDGELVGDLSLRGVTRPVTIMVTPIGEGDDPWGGYRSGFEGETSIKAEDFGFPAWIGDVAIKLYIEGVRQK